MRDTLTLLECAVTHTALKERCERLQELYKHNNDAKLYGEIQLSQTALEKIKHQYLSIGGNSDWLD